MLDVLSKSLLIHGFIQLEFADQREEFYKQAATSISEDRLRYRKDIIVEGLENPIDAFIRLLQGHNFGKLIVHVS
ncbi:MAG: hypothetical protein ABF461_08135 [Zymomonas mobilis subsp. pomaceae]|uniref:hypothetical protein n=1 Tax=Zymomonas mobilis TaxID=542 RepID=UPI0002ED01DE|nr:hypothetical protein [Zymomonas mobilis]MDX5949286.1 hypothetical protein [Zymomonas mobilis subsp. pomaceae]GEB89707.1 hypothetical protein ZMO02_13440 [Zymomonas mobilis subsp. pomaceae]